MNTNRYPIAQIFRPFARWQRNRLTLSVALGLLSLLAFTAQATNYYVAANGDDTKDGKSPATAWKSITYLNTKMGSLQPGDSVLFRRGDTFVGQLNIGKSGNSTSKIVFSAYGSGANPVITGAVKLGQAIADQSSIWTQVGNTGIWRSYYKTGTLTITQLVVDGDRKWIARYPNEGQYFFTDAQGTNTSLIETNLGKAPSFFTGSKVAVRWVQDAWTNLTVSSVTSSTVTGSTSATVNFTSGVTGGRTIGKNGGYYFYGNLNMLDALHEWYFNDAVDSLYYMPPAGVDPNTLNIEGSLYDYNINTNGNDNLRISDLTLIRAAQAGVLFQNTDNAVFDRLTVREAYFRGFFSGNGAGPQYVTTNCTISNCTITDCAMGMLLWRTSNTLVTRNLIKRIGLKFPGFAQSYEASGIQTALNTINCTFSYNRIDSLSKNGIRTGGRQLIERNIISNIGFHTADLGGIYIGGGTSDVGTVVRNNFVYDFHTNNESWGEPLPDSYKYHCSGIYTDIYGKNDTLVKNTIYNMGKGIQSLNDISSYYYKNIAYNFQQAGMDFTEVKGSNVPGGSSGKHTLVGNVFYKKVTQSNRLLSFSNNAYLNDWGFFVAKSDSNRFVNSVTSSPTSIGQFSYDEIINDANNKPIDTIRRFVTVTLPLWRSRLNDQTSTTRFFSATTTASDPSRLFINPNDNPLTVTLSADTAWFNLDSTRVYGSITIEPWYSQVLVGIPLPKPPTPNITVSPNRTSLTQGTSDKLTLEVTNCPGKVIWQGGTGYGQNNRFIDMLATQPVGSYTFSAICQPDTRASDGASVSLQVTTPTLKVQLKDGDGGQKTNNQLKPELQLQNVGQAAVPLNELTLRYWFTTENYAPVNTFLDWAQVGTTNVKASFVRLSEPRQGADGYVEYRFEAGAGSLVANALSGPIQSRIAKQTWTDFNEGDDYSYTDSGAYGETDKVTLYRTGPDGVAVLIWGKEPALVSSQVSLKVESENKNQNSNGNTISTYLKLTNTGNAPVAYKDLAIRYWFTSEGNQPLNYWVDWAQLGASQVNGQFIKLTPARSGADTYFEIKLDSTLGSLEAQSTTGNIQYRLAKAGWSTFNESDDYSWKVAGAMAASDKITVYHKGQLVYGTEPAVTAGSRLKAVSAEMQLVAYPNPALSEVYLRGGEGAIDVRFQSVSGQQVLRVQSQFGQAISVSGLPVGLYLMQVDTPQGRWFHKLLKQ